MNNTITTIYQLNNATSYAIDVCHMYNEFDIIHVATLEVVDSKTLHKNVINEAFDLFEEVINKEM